MTTPGLVTVCRQGKVVMKIVASLDGYNAHILAESIREYWPLCAELAYKIAFYTPFGSLDCLVVVTKYSILYMGDDPLSNKYRETFHQPRVNPAYEEQRAQFIEIIDI